MLLLLVYACVVFLVELTNALVVRYGTPTIVVFHIFTLVEFILLSSIFIQWQQTRSLRRATVVLVILFSLLWLYIKRTADDSAFDSLVVTVEAVILVGLAVISLLTLALENTGNLFGNPRFWVSSGVLLYFAGNLIVFALFNQLSQQKEDMLNAWRFHAVLNFIAHVFYMTGYLCLGRFRK